MKAGFHGGVHAPLRKEMTAALPVEEAPTPETLVVPLTQHIGAPNEALVQKGDKVKKGQVIASSKAFVSAPVHSPVTGDVVELGATLTVTGVRQPAIKLKTTAEDPGKFMKPLTGKSLTPEKIRERVREAGIVGLGGAAFPTHVKHTPPPDKPITDVIINACECESYLTVDHRNLLESGESVIDGLKLIMKAAGAVKGYIAIEDNKPDAIAAMKRAVEGEGEIEVAVMPAMYPQGAEKQLIKALLGREVPSGGLPFETGSLVQNAGTAIAISEAVGKGKPLIERVVTITGEGLINPKNLKVKIGTSGSELIEFCGGIKPEAAKIVFGGPMTGFAVGSADIPVVKGTSGIVVLTEEQVDARQTNLCIRCGRCLEVCPSGLPPNFICDASGCEKWAKAEELGALDCIECGCCAYVCPAKRALVQQIKIAKDRILAARKK